MWNVAPQADPAGAETAAEADTWRAMALQGADKAALLGPLENAIKEAKTETARKHREDYCPCDDCVQRFKLDRSGNSDRRLIRRSCR